MPGARVTIYFKESDLELLEWLDETAKKAGIDNRSELIVEIIREGREVAEYITKVSDRRMQKLLRKYRKRRENRERKEK